MLRPQKRPVVLCPEILEDRITPTISFGSVHGGFFQGSNPQSVAVGDLANNGREDIVAAIYTTGIEILMNDGSGNFTAGGTISTTTLGAEPRDIALADMTGDGKLDLVITSNLSQELIIIPGNGDGTFQTNHKIVENLAYAPLAMTIADLNGDGKPDVVLAISGGMAVLLNSGTSSILDTPTYYNPSTEAEANSCVVVGDFSGNGRPEVAVTVPNDNVIAVYPNYGNGTFTTPTTLPDPASPAYDSGDLAVGDFNNDGKLDLVAGYAGTSTIGLFLGNGDGTFRSPSVINTEGGVSNLAEPIAAVDLDQDGNLDLVIANQTPYSDTILPGNGNGTFGTPFQVNSVADGDGLAVADVNGDGWPDLIAVGATSLGTYSVAPNTSYEEEVSSFNVSAPSAVTAGQPFTVQVTAEDPTGATETDYGGTVEFSSGDAQASLPPTTQFTASDDGVADFTVTLGTAGTQSITVVDPNDSSATGTINVTVNVGPLSANTSTVQLATSDVVTGSVDQTTIQLKDAYGNPIIGLQNSDFNLSLSGGTSTASFGTVTATSTPGTYTVALTGQVPGSTSMLILQVDGTVMNSQPTLTVLPGPVDPNQSTAGFATTTDQSGSTDTITIAVKDALGYPITGLTSGDFVLSLTGGTSTGTLGPVTATATPGMYTASFTGLVSGTAVSLSVAVSGVPLAATPTVSVLPGSVDANQTTANFSASTVSSGLTDLLTIAVKDTAGNAIPNLPYSDFSFALSEGTSTGTFGTVTETAIPGTYNAVFSGVLAGAVSSFALTIGGVAITDKPIIQVDPGAPSGTKSIFRLVSSTDASGSSDVATITMEDADGNAIPGLSGSNFHFTVSGGTSTGSFGPVTATATPGTYTASFTGLVAGTPASVSLKFNTTSLASQTQVTVTPGSVNALETTLAFSSPTAGPGLTDTLTIAVRDAAGNAVPGLPGGDFSFALTGGTSTGRFGVASETPTPGTYTVVFTGDSIGTSSFVDATVAGVAITSAPAVAVVSATPGAKSTVHLASLTDVSGTIDTATIVLENAAGVPIIGLPSAAFAFNFSGGGTSSGSFGAVTETATPGTYTANFTGLTAGTSKKIVLQVEGIAIASPLKITVTPGAISAAKTTASFAAIAVASGSSDLVTIAVRDAAGNPIAGLTNSAFALSLAGGTSTGSFGTVSATSTPGVYTSVFKAFAAGTASQLRVAVYNLPSTTQPTVVVKAGPVSAHNSTAAFANATVSSGGTDLLTLLVADAAGNPITGLTKANLSLTLQGGQTTGTFGTLTAAATPGSYTIPFVGVLAGTASRLIVKVEGVPLAAEPTVVVTPGPVSAARSTMSVASSTATSGQNDFATLQVVDAAGNRIAGLPSSAFTLSFSGGTSSVSFGTVAATTKPGIYSVALLGLTAGTAGNISVSIGGVQLAAKPRLVVQHGAVSGMTSTATFATPTVTAGGTDLLTLFAADAAGNPIVGLTKAELSLSLSGGLSTGTFGPLAATTIPGKYTLVFTGVRAGTASMLKAKILGVPLTMEPTIQVLPEA